MDVLLIQMGPVEFLSLVWSSLYYTLAFRALNSECFHIVSICHLGGLHILTLLFLLSRLYNNLDFMLPARADTLPWIQRCPSTCRKHLPFMGWLLLTYWKSIVWKSDPKPRGAFICQNICARLCTSSFQYWFMVLWCSDVAAYIFLIHNPNYLWLCTARSLPLALCAIILKAALLSTLTQVRVWPKSITSGWN